MRRRIDDKNNKNGQQKHGDVCAEDLFTFFIEYAKIYHGLITRDGFGEVFTNGQLDFCFNHLKTLDFDSVNGQTDFELSLRVFRQMVIK